MNKTNPFTLFLILILLLLSFNDNFESSIRTLKSILDQTSTSVAAMKKGVITMQNSMNQIRSLFIQQPQLPAE